MKCVQEHNSPVNVLRRVCWLTGIANERAGVYACQRGSHRDDVVVVLARVAVILDRIPVPLRVKCRGSGVMRRVLCVTRRVLCVTCRVLCVMCDV